MGEARTDVCRNPAAEKEIGVRTAPTNSFSRFPLLRQRPGAGTPIEQALRSTIPERFRMMNETTTSAPLYIAMDERDNVAIVANHGGLPAGTTFASGLTLVDKVPQGHNVALVDLAAGDAVRRYNVVIGRATRAIPAGSWVHERLLDLPAARSLEGLPIATVKPAPLAPLGGYTFEGYRNPDGSVGSRNILAITTTVQCVAGVVEFAVKRIKDELLPRYPNVDDVIGLEHTYGCGVAIDAPGAEIPIRTLRD